MPYPTHLIPTTVVGSYPQPDWLVDRAALRAHGVPRVARAATSGASPSIGWKQAQDDATILAIRDMERAGIDIVTRRRNPPRELFQPLRPGARRHRRRASGRGVGASRRARDAGAARGRQDPPPRPGRIARRRVPAARTPTRATKITLPGPFTLSQQVENEFYKDEEELAMDYADRRQRGIARR